MKVSGQWGWAIAVLAAVTGCAPEKAEQSAAEATPALDPPVQRATTTQRQVAIDMEVPPGWVPASRPGERMRRIVSPDQQRAITVEQLPGRLAAPVTESAADWRVKDFARGVDTSAMWMQRTRVLRFGAQPWYQAAFTANSPDGPITYHWAMTSTEGIQWIFMLVDRKGQHRPGDFEKLLSGVKFK